MLLAKLRSFVGLTEEAETELEECLVTQKLRSFVGLTEEVEAPAPEPVAETVVEKVETPVAPTLTKLERLQEGLKARRAAEAAAAKLEADAIAEAEAIKAEYQAKVNAMRAEKAAADALAKELRLATESLAKTQERARNARQNADDLAETYAESLCNLEDAKENHLDALLAEFGC